VRIIYFAMLPTGVLNDTNVVVYVILGDLPVYLFLSIYTLLIFFWYAPHLSPFTDWLLNNYVTILINS
jgi:hypothetical protein